jgi:hypothetical protein
MQPARKQAVTVRLPRASSAPSNNTLACSQVGLVNKGSKTTIRGNKSAGNVRIRKTSLAGVFSRSLYGLPLFFQRAKMDKVEIRDDPLYPRHPRSINLNVFLAWSP